MSCGSIKFVIFGLIFSGTLLDNSNACGYQGCVDHAGKTRIPVAWSWHNFLMTFVSKLNGGSIYMKWCLQFMEKGSTAKASGSGFQETYFSVCLLIQLANKSISGVPKVLHKYSFVYFRIQLPFSCILKFSRIFVCLKIFFAWNVCCTNV